MMYIDEYNRHISLETALKLGTMYGLDYEEMSKKMRKLLDKLSPRVISLSPYGVEGWSDKAPEMVHGIMQDIGMKLYSSCNQQQIDYFQAQRQIQKITAVKYWHWRRLKAIFMREKYPERIHDLEGTVGFPEIIISPGDVIVDDMEVLQYWVMFTSIWEILYQKHSISRAKTYEMQYRMMNIYQQQQVLNAADLLRSIKVGSLRTDLESIGEFLKKELKGVKSMENV